MLNTASGSQYILYRKNEEENLSSETESDSESDYDSESRSSDDRSDAGEDQGPPPETEDEREDVSPMEALAAIAAEGESLLDDMQGAALVFPSSFDAFLTDMDYNRAPHLPCFDHNRVILKDKLGTTEYINASYVAGYNPQSSYIFAQAPFNSATKDLFWRMVVNEKPTIIIVLGAIDTKQIRKNETPYDISQKNFQKTFAGEFGCKTFEEAEKAIHINQEFWPSAEKAQLEFAKDGAIAVTNTGVQEDTHINVHNLSIVEGRQKPNTTTLVHFKDWLNEDPLPEFLCDMRAAIKIHYIRSQKKSNAYRGKILLVCPTGVSRCGIYALVDIVVTRLTEEHTVGVKETIMNLKQQRYGCFRNLQHYKAVREMIMRFAVSSGVIHEAAIGEKAKSVRKTKKKKNKNKDSKRMKPIFKKKKGEK